MTRAYVCAPLAALLLAFAQSTHAEYLLVAEQARVIAGEQVTLTLLVTNPSAAALTLEVPSEVHVQVDTGPASAVVEFAPAESGSYQLPPGAFHRVTLTGTLPQDAVGTVTLRTTGFATNPAVIAVEAAQPATAVPQALAATPAPASDQELIDKPPPLGVSVYEPVYLVVGGDGGLNAKFQISLKYRMFDDNGAIARRLPWLDDLYFSYSQTSLWDLNELSKPFRDSSYRPRFFYLNPDLGRVADGQVRLGLEGGFGHESNGKDGAESRSINLAYVRPMITFGDPEGERLYVAPMIYHYLDREENTDIQNYRGNVDLLVGYGRRSGWDFWGTFRKGKRSDFGSMELNVSYPLAKLSGGDLTGWLMAQYFSGYGESLIDYNRKLDAQFRIGLAVAL